MTKFLVIFYGGATEAEKAQSMNDHDKQAFMDAWMKWATDNKDFILDNGAPLSKAKLVGSDNISDIENKMTAYAIIQAGSQGHAIEIFKAHPHLTLHPKNRIEVIEIMPLPEVR